MKIIETKRLYLRELVLDDIEELSKVLSDPESMQYYPEPFSKDKVEKWIQWNIDNYTRYNHGLWAVILKFSRKLEKHEVSHTLFNFSRGKESAIGRWANGRSMDGEGYFKYINDPQPLAQKPPLKPAPPYIHDTLPAILKNNLIPPNNCLENKGHWSFHFLKF